MMPAWQQGVIRGPSHSDDGTSWIIKFGGSLLTRPRWPEELRILLAGTFAAEPARTQAPVVLDAAAWLSRGGCLFELPAGWHVTSDSIAAAVAVSCGAHLLLAKSVHPPCPASRLIDLSEAGWVDQQFPVAAAPVVVIQWAAPAVNSDSAA